MIAFVMFVLRFNVPVNKLSVMLSEKCLAQGHNIAEVGFEPPTSRSGARRSTTEPQRSPTAFANSAYRCFWRFTGQNYRYPKRVFLSSNSVRNRT